jgi:hypothetical protein
VPVIPQDRARIVRQVLSEVSKETLLDYLVHILPASEQEALLKLYRTSKVEQTLEDLNGPKE